MSAAYWSREAEGDLLDIVVFISVQDGRSRVAHTIFEGIKSACLKRARYPLTGEAYPELGHDVRGFPFKRWLILYRPRREGLDVLAVVDSARDLAAFFRERPLALSKPDPADEPP